MPDPIPMAMTADQVRTRWTDLRRGDLPTHGGRTLAYVYDSGLAEVDALGREALAAFGATNALDPTAFGSLAAMERELVGVARDLLHGTAATVGTVTSGGTESVLLAVLAARDAHPEIADPVLVVPTTIHAAFDKAAHLFGVRIVKTAVDPETRRADPEAIRAALAEHGERVVLVAVSAPSYAHGVLDPVPEVAAIAAAAGVRCHVDACIGGWLLPFADTPWPWDFAVDGVTSISVDLHKYGYTPKGASLLLHADPGLRRSHFFASADWPGYTMLNPTLQSTRSGAPVAAAWAVVSAIGRDGYAELARRAFAATSAVAAGIERQDHLHLVTRPDSTLICLTTDDALDVFTLADELSARGWFAQPQLRSAGGAEPATLHLSISAALDPVVEEFLDDLAASVEAAVASGPVSVPDELVAALAGLDPTTLDEATLAGLLSAAGLVDEQGLALPSEMAPVNALLDAAPPAVREAVLTMVLDLLSR